MEESALKDLTIDSKSDEFFVPAVNFNASSGQCSIVGESYLEDSFEFYDRLTQWADQYFSEGKDGLKLSIKLTYFNTSSSRALLDLLRSLQGHRENGKDIVVQWYYPEPDDGDMKEEAEDMIEESGLEMELIGYRE